MNTKPKVAVMMFTPTAREARVNRQVNALRGIYDLTVLGMGKNPFADDDRVKFVELPADSRSLPAKLLRRGALYATVAGKVVPWFDVWRHSLRPCWKRAFAWLMENRQDVLIAHEPEAAALAARVKARHGTKTILDLHEYAPLESDNNLQFRLIKGPHAMRTLRRWGSQADAALSVNDYFSELYVENCNMPRPVPIYNAPARLPEPRPPKINDSRIHLIHHGVCSPARELHLSIEALKTAPEHVVLHFMFAGAHPEYLARLEAMAAELPGRVFFEEPVDYAGILPAIARYDVGLYYIPNNTFNHAHTVANKFFDFLCAGLPLITGPNPGTTRFARGAGFGWITEDYSAAALGKVLNELTPESIAAAAKVADQFSLTMNADTEHRKLLELVAKLLS